MTENIVTDLKIPKYDIFFWTDSPIVLAWLRKPPCPWSTFVAKRVLRYFNVLDKRTGSTWIRISTTRGVLPGDLIANTLWWNGLEWLQRSQSQWLYLKTEDPETQLEIKSVRAHFTSFKQFDDVLERFSNLAKTLWVIAYVFRFFLVQG